MTNHDTEDAENFSEVNAVYKNNYGNHKKLEKPTLFEDDEGHCHTAIPVDGKVQELTDLHFLLSKHQKDFCLDMGAKVILNQIDRMIGKMTREALLADND